jgi:very-short-patch-repair endonuclease
MTDAERALWGNINRRQIEGFKFRRQHVLGPYIVDFVFLEQRLIVEIDSGQHAERLAQDEVRSRWLNT